MNLEKVKLVGKTKSKEKIKSKVNKVDSLMIVFHHRQ